MNVREELKAYYDNELTPAQAENVRKLLESDPSLAAEYEEIANVSQALRTREVQLQPYGLEATLGALTVREKRRSARPILQWAFVGVVGAFLCAILFPVFAQSKVAARRNVAMGAAAATSTMEMAKAPMPAAPMRGFDGAPGPQAAAKALSSRSAGGFAQERMRSQTADAAASDRTPMQNLPPRASTALVVKNGAMQLQVVSVDEAQQRVESITRGAGGYIESANRDDSAGMALVNMTIRVPADRFEGVLGNVRSLGKVLTQSFSGEDVTAQVVDTDARLNTLRSEERQYMMLMARANKIGEVLAVKERITQVREQIESLDAQQRMLRNQAKMSTLNVEISQKPKDAPKHAERTWSQNAWDRALERLGGVGAGLGVFGIYLLVFSPIWLPLGLAGWMAYRKYRW